MVMAAADNTKMRGRGTCGAADDGAGGSGGSGLARVVAKARHRLDTVGRRLVRHRNTVFAAGCAVLAGFGDQTVMAMRPTRVLAAYMLTVDVLRPADRRQATAERASAPASWPRPRKRGSCCLRAGPGRQGLVCGPDRRGARGGPPPRARRGRVVGPAEQGTRARGRHGTKSAGVSRHL